MILYSLLFDDAEYYQVKKADRYIELTKGSYYEETTKLLIKTISDNAPQQFYFAIPFQFWNKVGYYEVRDLDQKQILYSEIVRRDEFLANIFFLKIDLTEKKNINDQFNLQISYSVPTGGIFLNNFSLFFGQNDYNMIAREFKIDISDSIPTIYDISEQTSQVKFAANKYHKHETSQSSVIYQENTLNIGPHQYLPLYEFNNITIFYTTPEYTLDISSRREVVLPGLSLKLLDKDTSRRVHILDWLNVTNTDPKVQGLRQSRNKISEYQQTRSNDFLHQLSLYIPYKIYNLYCYDRVGKNDQVEVSEEGSGTQILIHLRHDVYGQTWGEIRLEYDADIVVSQESKNNNYGIIINPSIKVNQLVYYHNITTCIYAPGNAENIKWYTSENIDFDYDETAVKLLDFIPRQKKCIGRVDDISSYQVQSKGIALTYTLSEQKLIERGIYLSISIFAVLCAIIAMRIFM